MSEPEWTKESLTAKILAGRKALEETLARIPQGELETPILHDGWSVKDIIGHIGFWEAMAVSRFGALRAGENPGLITDMDALNARALDEWRKFSLAEIRRREGQSYRQLLDLVRDASDDELFKPAYFASWSNKDAFVGWVAANTWGHYEDHLPELTAWLESDAKS